MRIGIALINLDRDEARRAHMAGELGRLGLAYERFPAILGLSVPDFLRPWFFDGEGKPSPSLKPGEIGVYASHIALHVALLARDDLDALLVLEDDLAFEADFPDLLAALAASKRPFDVIRLSNPPKAPYLERAEVTTGRALVCYSRVPNNMGAYLISKAGARKTTQFRGLRRHAIDEDFRRPWDWRLETFGIVPAPIRANIFQTSSIDSLGARALGHETGLQKFARRRLGRPADWSRHLAWQISLFGPSIYVGMLARTLLYSLLKRLGFPESGLRQRLLRVRAKVGMG